MKNRIIIVPLFLVMVLFVVVNHGNSNAHKRDQLLLIKDNMIYLYDFVQNEQVKIIDPIDDNIDIRKLNTIYSDSGVFVNVMGVCERKKANERVIFYENEYSMLGDCELIILYNSRYYEVNDSIIEVLEITYSENNQSQDTTIYTVNELPDYFRSSSRLSKTVNGITLMADSGNIYIQHINGKPNLLMKHRLEFNYRPNRKFAYGYAFPDISYNGTKAIFIDANPENGKNWLKKIIDFFSGGNPQTHLREMDLVTKNYISYVIDRDVVFPEYSCTGEYVLVQMATFDTMNGYYNYIVYDTIMKESYEIPLCKCAIWICFE